VAQHVVEGSVRARDGVRIAYRDHGGEGRGLVLLHGGGANLESMDQYAERLGPGRRTVAIDVRSCGQSGDPDHFRLTDAAQDVATVVSSLGLGAVDVVGHSMGGFLAGFYGTEHPNARVVSIDGFGPGMVTVGTETERAEFRASQEEMKAAFFAMTAPPETGDRAWRDHQVEVLCETYPRIGYTAPNGRAMAERSFVADDDGTFRRHPSRQLFDHAFTDDGGADILRMYRRLRCPTLIVRCTRSGAPSVLDLELDALTSANSRVRVVRMPLTHMAPAWDALDEVVAEVEDFLDRPIAL
jgi:pimeloyl-ACP methyl ester carboxylesterase